MKIETPVLKRLGPVPFWRGESRCLDSLETIYRRAIAAAESLGATRTPAQPSCSGDESLHAAPADYVSNGAVREDDHVARWLPVEAAERKGIAPLRRVGEELAGRLVDEEASLTAPLRT